MKKLLAVVTSALMFTFLGSGTAFAGTNGPLVTTSGSSVKWIANGDYFQICDTDPDGDSVYVKFHYSGSGGDLRLNWTGGASHCVNRTYNITEGRRVYYQSCEDDTFTDTCSREVSGVA